MSERCENGCDLEHYHSHQGAPWCTEKPNADDEPRPEVETLRAKLKVAAAALEQYGDELIDGGSLARKALDEIRK